jgi:hypothetical protein
MTLLLATRGCDYRFAGLTFEQVRARFQTTLHQTALARWRQAKQVHRVLGEDAIFADDLGIAQIDVGQHGRGRLLGARSVKLAGGMRREVLAVLGQFAAGVGHVSVRMIVVVGGRRGQSRLPVLRQILKVQREMLKYHTIHSHCGLSEC